MDAGSPRGDSRPGFASAATAQMRAAQGQRSNPVLQAPGSARSAGIVKGEAESCFAGAGIRAQKAESAERRTAGEAAPPKRRGAPLAERRQPGAPARHNPLPKRDLPPHDRRDIRHDATRKRPRPARPSPEAKRESCRHRPHEGSLEAKRESCFAGAGPRRRPSCAHPRQCGRARKKRKEKAMPGGGEPPDKAFELSDPNQARRRRSASPATPSASNASAVGSGTTV